MRTLVWITHSFRLDSRLTDSLEGECTFVYYSPYYFSGKREQSILRRTSQQNLDAFYYSLHEFNNQLQNNGSTFYGNSFVTKIISAFSRFYNRETFTFWKFFKCFT